MHRWRQERTTLMEHQAELEALLCSQAGQLNVLKKGLRSVKFCLDCEEPRTVIRQQVDVLLQYCADPTSETAAATPQTVPIPKKRTTSATTPSSHSNGNSIFGATALAQQKRYTSTATLNRF
ncbi:hypothetical protein FGIG_07972 [Fasciola gigantica]|uniref:Uncharacterized protein n=1 Tax=Fasciola gigantica TaxID=46835 RepID=A0A504YJC1_FASGI|nr:hypothetical protein FGIG_07972 [Fasciola gigantica]